MITLESTIGIAAGTLTALSLLPQLIKMIREQKATDVSVGMFIILLSGLGLWVWYGILKKDLPIILTNGLSLIINILILALKAYYSRKAKT